MKYGNLFRWAKYEQFLSSVYLFYQSERVIQIWKGEQMNA